MSFSKHFILELELKEIYSATVLEEVELSEINAFNSNLKFNFLYKITQLQASDRNHRTYFLKN